MSPAQPCPWRRQLGQGLRFLEAEVETAGTSGCALCPGWPHDGHRGPTEAHALSCHCAGGGVPVRCLHRVESMTNSHVAAHSSWELRALPSIFYQSRHTLDRPGAGFVPLRHLESLLMQHGQLRSQTSWLGGSAWQNQADLFGVPCGTRRPAMQPGTVLTAVWDGRGPGPGSLSSFVLQGPVHGGQ